MNAKGNNLLSNKKKRLSEIQCFLLIFAFFIIRYLTFPQIRSSELPSSVTIFYLFTYDLGFIHRALIGSTIALFTDYLTEETLKLVISFSTIMLLALVSLMLGRVISKSDPNLKPTVILFVFFLLTAPFSHTLYVERHLGRLDIYWLLFTLLGLACMNRPVIRWVLPLLCFAAIATHHGFLFTYMPAIAIPLLYEVYRNKYSKRSILLFATSCFVLIIFSLYFQFFLPKMNFYNADSLGIYLSGSTNMKIAFDAIYADYFASQDYLKNLIWPMAKGYALPVMLTFIALSLPLIIIFSVFWRLSIRNAENNFLKFVFVLCALSPLSFIPAAVFGADWERWWAAVINCQFIFIFYFIASSEKSILLALKSIGKFFTRHLLVLFLALAFSATAMLSNINSIILTHFDFEIIDDYFKKALDNYECFLQ